jgi:hypothetical protein
MNKSPANKTVDSYLGCFFLVSLLFFAISSDAQNRARSQNPIEAEENSEQSQDELRARTYWFTLG